MASAEMTESEENPQAGSQTEEHLLLSVILPARDEQRSIAACVRSLTSQSEPGWLLGRHWELLVVDDGSRDETAALAHEAGANVVAARTPLPKGWTGENNALWTGVEQTRGEWLLFTTADTMHAPASLSRSIIEAERSSVAMLSWEPDSAVKGVLDRSVMPLVQSEIATAYPPATVNEPGKRVALATDKFLLVKRDALQAIGGIAGVAGSTIADVDLAFAAKKQNRVGLRFRHAPEMVRVPATGGFGAYWTASANRLALLLPSALALALWRLLDAALVWGLPLVALLVLPTVGWNSPSLHLYQAAVGLFWLRTLFRIGRRAARSHLRRGDLALAIVFGLPLFAALCYASWYRVRILRRVIWKGREYAVRRV